MKSVVLKIEGMHCGGCASTVKALLEREPGVRSAEVTFEKGEARVLYDPATLNEDHLIATVEQPGYRAAVLSST